MTLPDPVRDRPEPRGPREPAALRAKLRGCLYAVIACLVAGCASTVPEPPETSDHSLRFVARSGIATVEGRFSNWRVTASKVDLDDLATSFVEVEIDVASIETGNEDRDAHLRDPDYFEVERWPTATVRVGSVTPTIDPRVFEATFDVAIKDQRHSLSGSFRVESRSPLLVAGEVVIDRVAFGVGVAPSVLNPFAPRAEVRVVYRITLSPD
jgi:polyisoprenoid-binding protein YceI